MVILEKREQIRKRHRRRKIRFWLVIVLLTTLVCCICLKDADAPPADSAPPPQIKLSAFTPEPYLAYGTGSGTEISVTLTDPDTKNSRDLAAFAEEAWNRQWGYVWGTFGDVLTEELLLYKLDQYPEDLADREEFIRETWMNCRTADCVGLIKAYAWYDPESGVIDYCGGKFPDWGTDDLFAAAEEKGPLSTIPEIPGIVVFREGHVGIYMGSNIVIEAKGTEYGVVKTKLSESDFTHWMECPYIAYE